MSKQKNNEKKLTKKKIAGIAIGALAVAAIAISILGTQLIKQDVLTNGTVETANASTGIRDESEAESWTSSDSISEVKVDTSMTEDGETVTMYVPIPEGYVASQATGETTVAEGLVIYEGTEAVTDANVSEAKTTRNQWVWVPVDPSEVYWTNTSGQKYGIEYTFSSTGRTGSKSLLEPLITTNNYYFDYYLDSYASDLDSSLELESDMQEEFEEIMESIEKYGGFYIGRYEVGDGTTTSASTSRSGYNNTPVEMKGKGPYNNITWYQAYDLCKQLSGTNETVKTCLIYGCLWDATLEYMVDSGDKTYSDMVDSCSWGNYSNSTGDAATGKGSLRVTAYNEAWSGCNIYDMAGNVYEWTQQAYSSSDSYRYFRGGGYGYNGADYPASGRNGNRPYDSYNDVGCRGVLYIK